MEPESITSPRIAIPDKTRPVSNTPRSFYGVILVIALITILLITAIWHSFSSPSGRERSTVDAQLNKQIVQQLTRAHAQLALDHLTWPPGTNALETYRQILRNRPDAFSAQQGIENLGKRYIVLLRKQLQYRDFRLAKITLKSAEELLPHIAGSPVETELTAIREEIEQLKQRLLAKRRSPTNATAPINGLRDKLADGSLGPELVVVPAGVFMFGSPNDEIGRDTDEGPQTRVDIKGFAIGQTEVTFAEYEHFARATGAAIPDDNGWGREDRPVINISWRDAKNYLTWLTDQTGFHYRLPTEQEWEYAARAGTTTTFYTGDCLSASQANIGNIVAYATCPSSTEKAGKTVATESFSANSWGLHDIHGNVRELLEDCWFPEHDSTHADGSPRYTTEGGNCGPNGQRIVRGGVWNADAKSARVANRYAVTEREFSSEFGFRLARDLE